MSARLPLLIAAAAALLTGGCESVLAAQAEADHPAPGRLVTLADGRGIQIDCRGEGSPTVVLQSGGDVLGSLAWTPVLERAAETTRACAYSRAGMMWSDPARGPFEPEEVARDLHAALKAAGETPPYVLVGHSRGGLYNMIYAGLYRDEIAGLVFADTSHPDQEQRLASAGVAPMSYVPPAQELALAFRWTGLMRLSPYPVDASISDAVRAFYPKSAAANAREARARDRILASAGRHRDLQNWPVVVLARELPEQTQARRETDARNGYLLSIDGSDAGEAVPASEVEWRRMQADIAGWSSRGRLQVVPDSNHAFYFFRPDAVVSAIREVVVASRLVKRPPPQTAVPGPWTPGSWTPGSWTQ